MLSVIIPAYNEEAMLAKTRAEVAATLDAAGIEHELLFVDDGSTDRTWEEILACARQDRRVRGLRFSRNFGKEAAICAGLQDCRGDCCVVLDCDLQHPPEKIVEMYRLWEQGYEIVEAVKKDRGRESALHRLCARAFYRLISRAAKIDMSRASDFKLLDRKAILVLVNMKEQNAFFRALSSWIGFRTAQVEFEVQPRAAGESKWSTRALIRYAMTNITSFSSFPMQVITFLGVLTFAVSLVLGIVALVQKFSGTAVEGFTTVIILQLLFSSIIMVSLGIIGYYLAQVYEELKGRPKFIVSESCGETKE